MQRAQRGFANGRDVLVMYHAGNGSDVRAHRQIADSHWATWERALIRRLCMRSLDNRLGGITTETAQLYDKEVVVIFIVNGCVLVSPPFAAALPS